MGCASAVSAALEGIEGVDSVSVSLKEAKIVLKPGNKVTLEQIRKSIQQVGFRAGDTEVCVSGILSVDGDTVLLNVPGPGLKYALRDHANGAAMLAKLRQVGTAHVVSVRGTVVQPTDQDSTAVIPLLQMREFETGEEVAEPQVS